MNSCHGIQTYIGMMKLKRNKSGLRKKKQEELANKYHCDGRCYWSTGMCPRVDYCEHTRVKEFIATILIIPISIVGLILFVILFILLL